MSWEEIIERMEQFESDNDLFDRELMDMLAEEDQKKITKVGGWFDGVK